MIYNLSKEQRDDIRDTLNQFQYNHFQKFGDDDIYKRINHLKQALSHDLTDEIVEKIEYRKQRALDIPSNHSDSVAYGLDVAKEIIKSYGEEK